MSRIGTLHVTDKTGAFSVLDDEGREVTRGQARPSVSTPGYVTLIFYGPNAPAPMRVPIDWLAVTDARDDW